MRLNNETLKQVLEIAAEKGESSFKEKDILPLFHNNGYDLPVYGARPLKRAIQREMETPIAKQILRGELKDGDTIYADVENERLVFKRLPELVKS